MSLKEKSSGEVGSVKLEVIEPKKIKTHPTFEGLLPIDEDLLKHITADMAANGYDYSKPVVLATWPGQENPVITDGHTRWQAAIDSGTQEIFYVLRKFHSEAAAMEYAMGLQTKRRITSDGILFRLIETYDSLIQRGGGPSK